MYYIYYIHIRFRALEFLPTFSRVLIQQANNHKNVIKLYNPIWLNDDFAFLSLGCKVRATRKKNKKQTKFFWLDMRKFSSLMRGLLERVSCLLPDDELIA